MGLILTIVPIATQFHTFTERFRCVTIANGIKRKMTNPISPTRIRCAETTTWMMKKYHRDAYIPKSIDPNEIDPTLGGGEFTQCDHTSIEIIQNGSLLCGRNEVAYDAYDEFVRNFDILSKWIDLADSISDFITCQFVQSETADITATLTTVVDHQDSLGWLSHARYVLLQSVGHSFSGRLSTREPSIERGQRRVRSHVG